MKVRKEELEYAKLIKQVEFSHIHFGFSFKADESSFPTFEKSKKQEELIRHLVENIKTENAHLFCKQLYVTDFVALLDIGSN